VAFSDDAQALALQRRDVHHALVPVTAASWLIWGCMTCTAAPIVAQRVVDLELRGPTCPQCRLDFQKSTHFGGAGDSANVGMTASLQRNRRGEWIVTHEFCPRRSPCLMRKAAF